MATYTSATDAQYAIATTLGEYASDFDVEAIYEATVTINSDGPDPIYVITDDHDEFWAAVMAASAE